MLVVVAIISILIAILVPSMRTARNKVFSTKCKSNQRTIGTAFAMYVADHGGSLPVAAHADFRGGAYGLVTELNGYFSFDMLRDDGSNWANIERTCPMYEIRNRSYGNTKNYGSYCYRHSLQGQGSPPGPVSNGARLAGRMTSDLEGDSRAGAWSVFHWTPDVYGLVWDTGWTDPIQRTTPHDYYGIPAHDPHFNVLFADLHVNEHKWIHRAGVIPNGTTRNVPPEYRDDQYRIEGE
jgi:type II secretory pathway pseudopilin PulG